MARAVMEHGLSQQLPQRLYYRGPMFRRERPQKGRLRQFSQFGVEVLGVASPHGDVELLRCAHDALAELPLQHDVQLRINTLGDAESRGAYEQELTKFFSSRRAELSDLSRERLDRGAPLRVLDSKHPADVHVVESAPPISECLSSSAAARFDTVQRGLRACGVPATVDATLVRGLDYYSQTVFEFVCQPPGDASRAATVLAGGRYDDLASQFGSRTPIPGAGWAAGIERLAALLTADAVHTAAAEPPTVVVLPFPASLDDPASGVPDATHRVCTRLRAAGHRVQCDWSRRPLGKALRRHSQRPEVSCCVLIGEEEVAAGTVTVRYLRDSRQVSVDATDVAGAVSLSA